MQAVDRVYHVEKAAVPHYRRKWITQLNRLHSTEDGKKYCPVLLKEILQQM